MRPLLVLSALLLGAGLASPRDPELTVGGVFELVRQALAEKQPDAQIVKTLAKVKLAERIEQAAVDQLESEGAGPETVLELEQLAEESAKKPKHDAPYPFTTPPQPTLEEMRAAMRATADYAIHYAQSLPDFLCTESIKRYQALPAFPGWRTMDTLKLHLGYSEHAEEYKLVELNGKPSKADYRTVGGATSEGEFGSMMFVVFDPRSHARVFWDHWAHVRGRLTQVYSYAIAVKDSTYKMTFAGPNARSTFTTVAGASGFIYVDPETHAVLRVRRQATDLPPTFPIRAAGTVIDYDYGEVGGKRFFLPVHATVLMETREVRTRNEVEFGQYRKFQGESTISFGEDAETPPATKPDATPIKH